MGTEDIGLGLQLSPWRAARCSGRKRLGASRLAQPRQLNRSRPGWCPELELTMDAADEEAAPP